MQRRLNLIEQSAKSEVELVKRNCAEVLRSKNDQVERMRGELEILNRIAEDLR